MFGVGVVEWGLRRGMEMRCWFGCKSHLYMIAARKRLTERANAEVPAQSKKLRTTRVDLVKARLELVKTKTEMVPAKTETASIAEPLQKSAEFIQEKIDHVFRIEEPEYRWQYGRWSYYKTMEPRLFRFLVRYAPLKEQVIRAVAQQLDYDTETAYSYAKLVEKWWYPEGTQDYEEAKEREELRQLERARERARQERSERAREEHERRERETKERERETQERERERQRRQHEEEEKREMERAEREKEEQLLRLAASEQLTTSSVHNTKATLNYMEWEYEEMMREVEDARHHLLWWYPHPH